MFVKLAHWITFIAAIALVPAIALCDDAPPAAPPVIHFDPVRLGNVFLQGQSVEVNVTADHTDRFEWKIINAWGEKVLVGSTPAGDQSPTLIKLPLDRLGYFEMTVEAKAGDKSLGTGVTRLAVLTPFDLSSIDDSPFGVMTHFAQGWPIDIIPLIETAGVKQVRDEVYWAHVETTKGHYDFSKFDAYMRALGEHHIRSLTPLTFGNPLYDRSDQGADWCIAPYTDSGREGYAAYGQHVLEHFGKQIQAVEIWNEYNGSFAPGPADGRPEVYAEMIKTAYPVLKKARPDVPVLGCSTIGFPFGWLEDVFRHGGLAAMDVVSIHPYGYGSPPEWIDAAVGDLHKLIRKYNDGKDKPIWATEEGWFTSSRAPASRGNSISELTKARYLVRAYTLLSTSGVDKTFWYLFRDYDMFGTMGMVGQPQDPAGRYAPHAAYVSMAVMCRQLSTAKFAEREATEPAIRSYRFDRDGKPLHVIWTTEPRTITLKSDLPLSVTDLFGEVTMVQPIDGRVHVGISESPIYVAGPCSDLTVDETFSMKLPPEFAVGEPLPATMTGGPEDGDVTAEIGDRQFDVGTLHNDQPVDLTATQAEDERWTRYTVKADGKTVLVGSALTQMRSPVVLDDFPHLIDLKTLRVRLCNFSHKLPLKVASIRWSLGGQSGEQAYGKEVAPGEIATINIPIQAVKPWTLYPATLETIVSDRSPISWKGDVTYNPVPKHTPTIDGDLSDWDGLDSIDLSPAPFVKLGAPTTGDADLSGHVWLSWDEKNLYFAAKVRDDVFFQDQTGYGVWKGDNFQLGFDPVMPWPSAEPGPGNQELGLTLTPIGTQFFRFYGPGKAGVNGGVPLVVKRMGEFTLYECAIPWSQLDSRTVERGSFSFALYLNDSDGKGRRGYKKWADIKDSSHYQPCYLQP